MTEAGMYAVKWGEHLCMTMKPKRTLDVLQEASSRCARGTVPLRALPQVLGACAHHQPAAVS